MSENQAILVADYLRRAGLNVDETRVKEIRDRYRQVLQLTHDADLPENVNEEAMQQVAQQLNLRIEMDDARDYLRECISYGDIQDAVAVLFGKLAGEEIPIDEPEPSLIVIPAFTPPLSRVKQDLPPPTTTHNAIMITEIDCLVTVKMPTSEVDQFIERFLLQDGKAVLQSLTTDSTTLSVRDNEGFPLRNTSLLYLFIRKQLRDLDTTISSIFRGSGSLRLTKTISSIDDFGIWEYDHWRGLFDLELRPHDRNTRFPPRWSLTDDARIFCQLHKRDGTGSGASLANEDRPRTDSLEVFVHDVCARENNGQGRNWLTDLHKEAILTYEHLANLRQSEWDNIQKLPMNAKKILKTAIDRERDSADSNRRQHLFHELDPEEDDGGHSLPQSTKESSYSRSELLANLHLIKLFICHTLRDERVVRRHGALPKLEAACLERVITEMRDEGFADDGLFPKITEFFLPLTIAEQELCIERGLDQRKRQKLNADREQLLVTRDQKMAMHNEHEECYRVFAEEIVDLEKKLTEIRNTYTRERAQMVEKLTGDQQQEQAKKLQELNQQRAGKRGELLRKIRENENQNNELKKDMDILKEEIEQIEEQIAIIDVELTATPKYVDKKLIKPARGLIMYGPPGTGKSEIMSKLAVKLGIVMVGLPLAAGELNRPLVGESERVIIALCQRCYRVPYAMCCVSIDEIDALAPKRDEDSSEGKVDKISVLLSLIEGIKDVPNLMILCATNRLHMMDEAFLRRMSGKFFVGRPSSNARLSILQSIPDCALKPGILDRLSTATTNFSGAAVRALTRMATVKVIHTRRTDANHQVDYIEALEMADRTAQQYQILFGSETLPRLLLRNTVNVSRPRLHQLPNNRSYSGRIVVDLYNGYVRIEVNTSPNDRSEKPFSIVEQKLHSNETNVQSLLDRLTSYGKHRNVQLLQLIDLNLLAAQGAYDEKKVFETLKDRYDECVAYTRSMIVYDLDALVGVNKSESDSNMGRSTSSSVVNQNIYTYVRARFRDSVMEDKHANQSTETIERWAVAIIREPFLLRQFCNDVQFARTREEEKELEQEERRAKDILKCVKCKDLFIENENKMGNCVHHDGFIYDNSAADLTIHKLSEAVFLLNKIECDVIIDTDRRDELERQKNKFKWICCDAVLASGNLGGCKKGKHDFKANENDQEEQRRLADTTTNYQLDPNDIQQWEDTCHTNEEYIEKWLKLLAGRS